MRVNKVLAVTSVTACLVLSISSEAQAKNIESYDDYRMYCSPAAFQYGVQSPDCSRYKGIYENRLQEELEQRQIRRRSTQREASPEFKTKGYVGGSLGAFFPTGDIEGLGTLIDFVLGTNDFADNPDTELDTGFGGSLFAGAKFNKNFATDLEFTLFSGGTDIDDTSFSQWGIYLNPRLILPLSKKESSIAFYLSPGIGISKGKVSYDLPEATTDFLGTEEGLGLSLEDDTSFAWQIKAGVDFPFEERYKGFTQVRYVNPTGENTIDTVSTEVGFAVEF